MGKTGTVDKPKNPLNFSKKESIPHGPVRPKDGRERPCLSCPSSEALSFRSRGVILATILEQSVLGWGAESSFSFFPSETVSEATDCQELGHRCPVRGRLRSNRRTLGHRTQLPVVTLVNAVGGG